MLPAERDGQPDPEPVLAGHVPAQDHGVPVLVQAHEVSTTYHDRLLDGSIGKVAISPNHEGLQVDGSNFSSGGTSPDDRIGKAPEVVCKAGKESTTSLSPPDKSKSRKKLISLVIALILVIIAAVVGGVLGSRTVGGSTSTSPRPSDTPNNTTPDADTTSLIKQRSSLSVTAWRKSQGGMQIFLYYQSLNGTLRWSTYNDPQNADTYSNSYWGESKALGSLEADQTANDTGLAATTILWDTEYMPQINVFYAQSGDFLRAKWNVNNEATYHQYKGFNSASEDDGSTAQGSCLAGYWPYYARLDADNAVAMWRDDPRSDRDSYETGNWSAWFVPTANAMAGSKLAVVPTGPNMTSLSWWNYGLFYQATTGELALIQPDMSRAKANNTFIDSWRSDTGFPSIPLAPGASFTAFATARPNNDEGLVNTYVLYQEPSSRISMVYLENKSQWVITHPEALSIADNGTSIACVTMPMTQRDADGKDLPLETASNHANRCYFQRAGHVIEVVMNGTDWTELGTVPIE